MVTIRITAGKATSKAQHADGKQTTRKAAVGLLDEDSAEARAALEPEVIEPVRREDFLSTGSTMLNLAMSGKYYGGHVKGRYTYFMGDSDSGKSFIVGAAFAEAALDLRFDQYRFIYDGTENEDTMTDLRRMIGDRAYKRIEPPRRDKEGVALHSTTIEEVYDHIDDANKAGVPFIYVLDSLDGVSAEADLKKAEENKKIRRGQKKGAGGEAGKVKGDYGMAKAKTNSQRFPQILHRIKKLGSILIIISQTRDNIDPIKARYQPKTVGGGRGPKFYADIRVWTSVRERLWRKPAGVPVAQKVGVLCRYDVDRSRITGRPVYVDVPIYYLDGIDDLGACIRYLLEQRHWKKVKAAGGKADEDEDSKVNDSTWIAAPEFRYKGPIGGLVRKIEDGNAEEQLHQLVQQVWDRVLLSLKLGRKPRYV